MLALQYWEPRPAIQLNNAEAVLASEEAEKEAEVLVLLTQLVSPFPTSNSAY
jgi:hypothetical protein